MKIRLVYNDPSLPIMTYDFEGFKTLKDEIIAYLKVLTVKHSWPQSKFQYIQIQIDGKELE
jgi:hypothetical protein